MIILQYLPDLKKKKKKKKTQYSLKESNKIQQDAKSLQQSKQLWKKMRGGKKENGTVTLPGFNT